MAKIFCTLNESFSCLLWRHMFHFCMFSNLKKNKKKLIKIYALTFQLQRFKINHMQNMSVISFAPALLWLIYSYLPKQTILHWFIECIYWSVDDCIACEYVFEMCILTEVSNICPKKGVWYTKFIIINFIWILCHSYFLLSFPVWKSNDNNIFKNS